MCNIQPLIPLTLNFNTISINIFSFFSLLYFFPTLFYFTLHFTLIILSYFLYYAYFYFPCYMYHRTTLPLLLDSTQHMPISQCLADTAWFVTFLFRPRFSRSRCPSSVESPPMIRARVSQYCTDSSDSSSYWLATILRIQWLISMITDAFVDSPRLVLDD